MTRRAGLVFALTVAALNMRARTNAYVGNPPKGDRECGTSVLLRSGRAAGVGIHVIDGLFVAELPIELELRVEPCGCGSWHLGGQSEVRPSLAPSEEGQLALTGQVAGQHRRQVGIGEVLLGLIEGQVVLDDLPRGFAKHKLALFLDSQFTSRSDHETLVGSAARRPFEHGAPSTGISWVLF